MKFIKGIEQNKMNNFIKISKQNKTSNFIKQLTIEILCLSPMCILAAIYLTHIVAFSSKHLIVGG